MAAKRGTPMKMNSPPPKKQLFSSPQKSEKINVTGYLVCMGVNQKGDKGNEFFDINIQTGETEYMNIKVMMMGLNVDVFRKRMGHPIRLVRISHSESGTNFYNERYGSMIEDLKFSLEFEKKFVMVECCDITDVVKDNINIVGCIFWLGETEVTSNGTYFRNGIIKDQTGQIPITVWRKAMINSIKNESWYILTDMATKIWIDLKLDTTRSTIIQATVEDMPAVERPELRSSANEPATDLLDDPEIVAVEVTETLSCLSCHTILSPEKNEKFVRCTHCQRKQISAKLPKSMNGVMDVVNKGIMISLEINQEVITTYFGVDTVKLKTEDVEEKLLLLENANFVVEKDTLNVLSINDKIIEE